MKFPAILKQATVHAARVLFPSSMSDDELVELMEWKRAHGITHITPSRLRALFRTGVEKDEIRSLFKKNNKYSYLVQEMKRRPRVGTIE